MGEKQEITAGNGVKMREALEATNKFLEVAIVNGKVTSQDISRLRNIVSTALTESPRNCDRFDDLNSAQRYYIEHGCPKGLGKIVDGEIRKTPWKSQFEKWLFSKEKGETDGVK